MKRFTVFAMAIAVALACTFAFAACGNKDEVNTDDIGTLVENKRYIYDSDAGKDAEKQRSFVFRFNGTGEYTYHYDYESDFDSYWDEHVHYVIYFKYTYVDADKSAVVCFFDSIKRLEGDDGSYTTDTTWSKLVTVSKNVLSTVGTGYSFWINEDYLKTLTHFGEEID